MTSHNDLQTEEPEEPEEPDCLYVPSYSATAGNKQPTEEDFGNRTPPELSSDPCFLEKFSHYYTTESAPDASKRVLDSLGAAQVDTTIDSRRYCIHCDAYTEDGGHVAFDVNFYTTVSSGQRTVVVEYQRKKGSDIIAFSHLYYKQLHNMHEAGVIQVQPLRDTGFAGGQWAPGYLPLHSVTASASASASALSPVCAERDADAEAKTKAEAEVCMRSIEAALKSPYYDVKSKGSSAACSLSVVPAYQHILAQHSLVDVVIDHLACNSADVSRDCTTVIANLVSSSNKDTVKQLPILDIVPQLIRVLFTNPSKQSQRQAIRALVGFSRGNGVNICKDQHLLAAAIQRAREFSVKDSRTRDVLATADPELMRLPPAYVSSELFRIDTAQEQRAEEEAIARDVFPGVAFPSDATDATDATECIFRSSLLGPSTTTL